MKNKFLITLITLLACFCSAKADIAVNEKNFPDMGFRRWIQANIKGAQDGVLSDEEIAAVKEMEISHGTTSDMHVNNINGIAFFTELEELCVYNCPFIFGSYVGVHQLDLSKNLKLKSVRLSGGVHDDFFGNSDSIHSVNVKGLPQLEQIVIQNPAFSELDLSGCGKLKSASVTNGVIVSLNLEGCVSLDTLVCSGNRIASLNLSQLPSLTFVDCSNNILRSLDFSGKYNLKTLNIAKNHLSSLTIEGFNELLSLDCSKNSLWDLSVSNCLTLEVLNCSDNLINKLNISNCENLKEINSMGNSLQTISLSNLPQLRYYNCKGNSLKNLNFLRGCSSLKTLCCSNNRFEHLDCSWLTALDSIDFSRCNKLKSVPILPVGIKKVICSNVPIIANVDWARYTELIWLEASNCELTTFDASKCSSSLEVLCLLGNHIMELDLSTLNRLDWRTSSLWQEVKLPAVYREDRSMWEVFLPASFDFTRVESVDGRYMGGSPSRGDTGTPTHVRMECFTDENGQKRCSFFTDRIKRGYDRYGNSTTPFFYHYKTNNSGVPSFGVEVVGYQVPSGVEDLAADKTVKGVVYYDLQGHESAVPFSGFNIEVTQFTDGTSQSKKVVK